MLNDYAARYDAIVGPWVAVMVDGEGRPLDVRDLTEGNDLAVAVVRRSAAPVGGVLPSGGKPQDTLFYQELVVGEDPVEIRWEQAKAAAIGMNLVAAR
ncbi:hypothetical protein [Micromonospora chalcea]|uniref:hypothetical protein n=1 Tax=Micromonospora chalcea TaxID=1874 RepID=UPI003D71EA38